MTKGSTEQRTWMSRQKDSLGKIVKICTKYWDRIQYNTVVTDVFSIQVKRKAWGNLSNAAHPLFSDLQPLPLGSRFSFPLLRSNHYKYAFIPAATSIQTRGVTWPSNGGVLSVAAVTTQELWVSCTLFAFFMSVLHPFLKKKIFSIYY